MAQENRLNFNSILLVILIIVVLFLSWRLGSIKDNNEDIEEALKKSIILNDSLTKEADGRYAKLVNYYNSQSDLKDQLKKSNREVYDLIKKQEERILSLTNAVITLENAVEEGRGSVDPVDTNKIRLTLRYPDEKDPFINWIGFVDRQSAFYRGEWSFGRLPLQIILTEESRGLWKSRLIGPDWFKVDSLTINSLPAEDYNPIKPRIFQFLIGTGYIRSLYKTGSNAISVGGGISFYNKHNIFVNATTNRELGLSYYYKFETFKKKTKTKSKKKKKKK